MEGNKVSNWRESMKDVYDFKRVRQSGVVSHTSSALIGAAAMAKVEADNLTIKVIIKDERASPVARLMAETVQEFFTVRCEGDVDPKCGDESGDESDEDNSASDEDSVHEESKTTRHEYLSLLLSDFPDTQVKKMPERNWARRKEVNKTTKQGKKATQMLPDWVTAEIKKMYDEGDRDPSKRWTPAPALAKLKKMAANKDEVLPESLVTMQRISREFSTLAQRSKLKKATTTTTTRASTTQAASTTTTTTTSSASSTSSQNPTTTTTTSAPMNDNDRYR
jgi:hypothetical protein